VQFQIYLGELIPVQLRQFSDDLPACSFVVFSRTVYN
jgi:hypothetical protein